MLGSAATELVNLNTVGIIGLLGVRGQVSILSPKGKVSMVAIMDSRIKTVIRTV